MKRFIVPILAFFFLLFSIGFLASRYLQGQSALNYFGDSFSDDTYWLAPNNTNVSSIEYTKKYMGKLVDMFVNGVSVSGQMFTNNFVSLKDADGNPSGAIPLPSNIVDNAVMIEEHSIDSEGNPVSSNTQTTLDDLVKNIKVGDQVYFWIHKDKDGNESLQYFSLVKGI